MMLNRVDVYLLPEVPNKPIKKLVFVMLIAKWSEEGGYEEVKLVILGSQDPVVCVKVEGVR